jgi:hypothetical protein
VTSWADFEAHAPEIAAAGRRLLPEVSFLATVSATGRPRVHPFCPAIADGRLWAFILQESPKRRDLDHNRQYAIHALPGAEDEQFFVAGLARRVIDTRLREVALRAMPYSDADERHLLYEFEIERALWTTWDDFQKPGMRARHRKWACRVDSRRMNAAADS